MSVLLRLAGLFIDVLVVIILCSRTLYFNLDLMDSGRRTTFDLLRLIGLLGQER